DTASAQRVRSRADSRAGSGTDRGAGGRWLPLESQPQVDLVLLEVANEEVGDAEKHGQGSQAILQRRVARHNRMDRPLDHVVNDVGGERVLAKRAKEADLKAGDIAQRDEQRI